MLIVIGFFLEGLAAVVGLSKPTSINLFFAMVLLIAGGTIQYIQVHRSKNNDD